MQGLCVGCPSVCSEPVLSGSHLTWSKSQKVLHTLLPPPPPAPHSAQPLASSLHHNTLGTFPSQGLCMGCSLCLEH